MKKLIGLMVIMLLAQGVVFGEGGGGAEEAYPAKPITLVIPYAAGGSADSESRLISDMVSANLGQPINLVFKPGGANIPGVMEVLNAPADGYTGLWWATPVIAVNPQLRDTPYTHEDLQPVITVIDNPVMMFVRNDSAIQDLDDFVAGVENDNLTIGINAIGSVPYMASAQIAAQNDLQLNYITQQTNPAAAVALMGGHVEVAFGTGPQLRSYGEDIRAVAVFSPQRNPAFPDVPTAAEQGYDVLAPVQSGLAVKTGTPDEIVDILEEAYLEVIRTEAYLNQARERGMFVAPESMWTRAATESSWQTSVDIYGAVIEENDLRN